MKKVYGVVLAVLFTGGTILAPLAAAATTCPGDEKKPVEGKKKPDPEAMFKRLDKDGDGKLTLEEFSGARKTDEAKEKAKGLFTKKDKDGDGSLTKAEVVKAPKKPKGEKKPKGDKKKKKEEAK